MGVVSKPLRIAAAAKTPGRAVFNSLPKFAETRFLVDRELGHERCSGGCGTMDGRFRIFPRVPCRVYTVNLTHNNKVQSIHDANANPNYLPPRSNRCSPWAKGVDTAAIGTLPSHYLQSIAVLLCR